MGASGGDIAMTADLSKGLDLDLPDFFGYQPRFAREAHSVVAAFPTIAD